jgi:isocitrate/isopropylmalate dehydrogenase
MTALLAVFGPIAGTCQDIDLSAELAKKLANPVASLISVSLQFNYTGAGASF